MVAYATHVARQRSLRAESHRRAAPAPPDSDPGTADWTHPRDDPRGALVLLAWVVLCLALGLVSGA